MKFEQFLFAYQCFFSDTQKPNITNCPKSQIAISERIPIGYMVPELQIQDNGGIKHMMVSPAWPSSQSYISSSIRTPIIFTYTVTDYGNNEATCSINVIGKGDCIIW